MSGQRMKRHALTQPDSGRVLWVGDDGDWSRMRASPAPRLVCPADGCGDPLHAVQTAKGTRFLRWSRSGGGCPHWWTAPSGGGGPESAQHLWLKARLASICLELGWSAVPEDPTTRADVWLPQRRLALEVQLRRSDLLRRTRARYEAGASCVVWFVAPRVTLSRSLFMTPALRLAVVSAADAARDVQPWIDGEPARLVVFGPIWRWRDWRLATGRVSAYGFLAELLTGALGWCPPGTPGIPSGRGGWVRWDHLALSLGRPQFSRAEREELQRAQQPWVEAQWQRRRRAD